MEKRENPVSVRMLTAKDLAEVVGNIGLAYRLLTYRKARPRPCG